LNALGIYSDYTVKKSNFHQKYKEVLNDQGCNIEKLCQFRYNDKIIVPRRLFCCRVSRVPPSTREGSRNVQDKYSIQSTGSQCTVKVVYGKKPVFVYGEYKYTQ
jgi:hypothetical protein